MLPETQTSPFVATAKTLGFCLADPLPSPPAATAAAVLSPEQPWWSRRRRYPLRSLSLPFDLETPFFLRSCKPIFLFFCVYLEHFGHFIAFFNTEEDPGEHKQQTRPRDEERQVYPGVQDRPQISSEQQRYTNRSSHLSLFFDPWIINPRHRSLLLD